ncbi:TIGR03067 domain-containing protein [Tuwongella immobilis]|uniref:TIGR03067 domain-containing protein n=1 Tax=Tuwongella immobilis TaxID=692036 RepID=A0A6C2YWT6_9BACT|nr:TIGR03067 domain-containing protein [Tuwongella immobilis]VIP05295.1 Uncharacterized protein OS=Rhodopirellula maiorica SM1 GN=RMSM_07301 PE=4 SV=1 [Tuwongella immobilis]VTS07946.1 Uncharacterized protein OS=Rhodopirellula maiorica SM1 GN=RMSM_07301 PE=4 SV=1 [Tuwongella immobilis]
MRTIPTRLLEIAMRRMFQPAGLIVWLLLIGTAHADEAATKREFKALQGTWTVIEAQMDGDSFDRIVGGTLKITDVNFEIKTKSGSELTGDLHLDPTKKPKHLNFTHQSGALQDKTWQAIYEIKDGELKLCYAEADSGKDRPDAFETTKDSGRLFLVLKRESK